MELQKIGILDDGTLVLPDDLKESLKKTPELWMAWNDDLIVIGCISYLQKDPMNGKDGEGWSGWSGWEEEENKRAFLMNCKIEMHPCHQPNR